MDCQIELENEFDYKQGYWISKGTSVTLEGVPWGSGYPELRTNLVISVKFEALIEIHITLLLTQWVDMEAEKIMH